MSAATFRRLGKIEQAKGSIQEAEVRDEDNPNVWVQVSHCLRALEGGICRGSHLTYVSVYSWDCIILH